MSYIDLGKYAIIPLHELEREVIRPERCPDGSAWQFCVYIILCKDNTKYIGFTGSIRRRLYRHILKPEKHMERHGFAKLLQVIYTADSLTGLYYEQILWKKYKHGLLQIDLKYKLEHSLQLYINWLVQQSSKK